MCRKSGSGTCNVPCRGTFDKYIWPLWHFIFETNGMDAVVLYRLVSIFLLKHFNNYRSFLRVTPMFYERDLVATDLQSHLLRNACYCIIQMFFRFYFPSVLTSFDLEIAFFTYCLRIDTFLLRVGYQALFVTWPSYGSQLRLRKGDPETSRNRQGHREKDRGTAWTCDSKEFPIPWQGRLPSRKRLWHPGFFWRTQNALSKKKK